MKRLALILAAFLALAGSAGAQTITVINQAHVRPAALAKVERAIVAQHVDATKTRGSQKTISIAREPM